MSKKIYDEMQLLERGYGGLEMISPSRMAQTHTKSVMLSKDCPMSDQMMNYKPTINHLWNSGVSH